VEPLSDDLARMAGEALRTVGVGAIDAIVMASAARRGDRVLTSDVDDLALFKDEFPEVRLIRV